MKKRVVHVDHIPRNLVVCLAGDYRPDLKYKLLMNNHERALLVDLIDDHIVHLLRSCKESGTSDPDLSFWFDLANRLANPVSSDR